MGPEGCYARCIIDGGSMPRPPLRHLFVAGDGKRSSGRRMKNLFLDSQHWLARAEETRKLAAQIMDPVSSHTMLEIAEGYESLARRAAQRFQESQKSK
jgi:hypothetical protein